MQNHSNFEAAIARACHWPLTRFVTLVGGQFSCSHKPQMPRRPLMVQLQLSSNDEGPSYFQITTSFRYSLLKPPAPYHKKMKGARRGFPPCTRYSSESIQACVYLAGKLSALFLALSI